MCRLRKLLTFLAHVTFLTLCWHYATHGLHGQPGRASLLVSALFTLTVSLQFTFLLRTYANIFSRILFRESYIIAVPMAVAALALGPEPIVRIIAAAGIAWWGFMYYTWYHRAAVFVKQGCGPIKADTWVSPDAGAIRVGDVILTSGRMATLLHQSIGHVEVAIMMDGELVLFSAWFETGACINPVARICKPSERNHYIVHRPRVAWTALQIATVELVAKSMLLQNRQCAADTRARREKLPAFIRNLLNNQFPPTGYDWLSMVNGQRRANQWSCAGIWVELNYRAGIDIGADDLGSGAAGAGTGWFDTLNAEEIRRLRALRCLTLTDEADYKASLPKANATTNGVMVW